MNSGLFSWYVDAFFTASLLVPTRVSRAQTIVIPRLTALLPLQRVSQNVCEEHAGYKLSEIPSVERIRMRRQIQTTIREVGLPALDDDAIEWRISKCMPELRVKMRGEYWSIVFFLSLYFMIRAGLTRLYTRH